MFYIHMNGTITEILLYFVAFVMPVILTIWNIYNCCSSKPKKEKTVSCLTIFMGGILYFFLYAIQFNTAGDWYEQVNTMENHYSISSEYAWAVGALILLSFVGYFILLFIEASKIPPLISVMSVAMLALLNIFQIVYAIQIARNVSGLDLYLYVYYANILILSASVIRKQIIQQVDIAANKKLDGNEHRIFQWMYSRMTSFSKYSMLVFICMFFIVAVFEIIFVLVGQGVDAPIKAFTDTADWTFSKQVPPPPVDYEGHYLCTVAAGGHRKVVRPLRLGTRRGKTIIVNRQLCIANAFEEVIQEKFPRFHKSIRYFYDTYGYPVSRHITSPVKADIVYILMKPLEWAFLIFLYLVDLHPEERIGRQYKRGEILAKQGILGQIKEKQNNDKNPIHLLWQHLSFPYGGIHIKGHDREA